MKKYLEPRIAIVEVAHESVMVGSLKGDGLDIKVNNTTVDGAADAKSGFTPVSDDNSSIWDD